MSVRQIYSKAEPNRLLHSIADGLAPHDGRQDITPADQFLQASVVPLARGRVAPPHTHAPRPTPSMAMVTQESWVVVRGAIRVRLYDLDQTFLHEHVLPPGSLLVTYGGGHSLESMEEDTVMLEFKNGPYLGRDVQPFELVTG